MNNEITIVVFANAKDFFLTKICIASIRYYYPNIEIILVKDELNGRFNSRILQNIYNVKELRLSKKFFGWAAAKLHFLIEVDENKNYLCIDSDIIFVGKVLSKFEYCKSDFIVSSEEYEWSDVVKRVFVDPEKVISYYPNYSFPGFFFNAGQTIVNPSKITAEDFNGVFDPNRYPYYQDRNVFCCVDQSILNALLPSLKNENRISFEGVEFMKSSTEFFQKNENNSIETLSENNHFLVHWAGDIRECNLKKMKGSELLYFFQNEFESNLSLWQMIYNKYQNILNSVTSLTRIKYYRNRILIQISNLCRPSK